MLKIGRMWECGCDGICFNIISCVYAETMYNTEFGAVRSFCVVTASYMYQVCWLRSHWSTLYTCTGFHLNDPCTMSTAANHALLVQCPALTITHFLYNVHRWQSRTSCTMPTAHNHALLVQCPPLPIMHFLYNVHRCQSRTSCPMSTAANHALLVQCPPSTIKHLTPEKCQQRFASNTSARNQNNQTISITGRVPAATRTYTYIVKRLNRIWGKAAGW